MKPPIRAARLVAALFLVTAPALSAPLVKSIRPLGARRGTTFMLTLRGREITPGSELVTDLPGTITRLAPPRDMKAPDTELPFLVVLGTDAPVGLYTVRLRNADGISNLALLSVGDFPEIENKKEPAGGERMERPVRLITPPVVVNSTLAEAERDVYRFTAQAGQALVFEVEARRLGSAIDPVVRVEDGRGRELAANDDAPGLGGDCRVEVRFQSAGEYRVVVADTRFSAQEQNFYRLKVGSYLYADGIFPAGWQRGKEVEATLFGGNLPKAVTVRPDLNLPPGRRFTNVALPVPAGSAGSLPLQFAVGDLPERLEPEGSGPRDLEPDTIVNGRISRPDEVDRYRLAVKTGEKWLIEVEAARLETSRMGAYLALADGSGKVLASAVDAGGLNLQKEFSFTPPERGVDPKILFHVPSGLTDLVVSVEEITRRGGPGYVYRLRATRRYEEFSLESAAPFINIPAGGRAVVSMRVNRDTYAGPIQLSVANLGADLSVEGGHVPAGAREGLLVLTAKPDASPAIRRLEIWGEALSSDREPIRRRAAAVGLVTPVKGARRDVTARRLGMELAAGIARPAPLDLEVSERAIKLVQGLETSVTLRVSRSLPARAPIRVEGERPGGIDVNIRGGTLEAGKSALAVQLSAGVTASTGVFDVALQARADAGGREVIVTSPCITVDLVRAFSLEIPSDRIALARGGTVELTGKVYRQYPYQDVVGLRVEDLPLDVTCGAVEVPASDSAFRLEFRAGPGAEPGDYAVRLAATGKMQGRKEAKDYTIPDRVLHLKIAAAPSASAGK